jgi:hypothetical protein
MDNKDFVVMTSFIAHVTIVVRNKIASSEKEAFGKQSK